MYVDAHQHYWRHEPGDYPWMANAPEILCRRYGPEDLEPLLRASGITKTILVQASPTVRETETLLAIAERTPSVLGVVGWIDFDKPNERGVLERLASNSRLVGIRPMVQDIADDDWILRPEIAWAADALQELDLTFDALGYPRHAARFLTFFNRHPGLRAVVDHGMKPAIARGEFTEWAGDMRDIAMQTQASCKLSGLMTEAAHGTTVNDLQPYVDHLLEVFGPTRLMWGSDWPVAMTAVTYSGWLQMCRDLLATLSPEDRRLVFGDNAVRFYQAEGD